MQYVREFNALPKNNDLLNFIRRSLLLIVVSAFVYYAHSLYDIETIDSLHFEIGYLLLAIFLFSVHYLVKYFIWHYLTIVLTIQLPWAYAIRARAIGEFGKYIPGKLWIYLYLFNQYSKKGVSKLNILGALYYDMFTQIIGTCLSLIIVLFWLKPDWGMPDWIYNIFILPTGYVILLFALHPKWLAVVLRVMRKMPLSVPYKNLIASAHLYLVNISSFLIGVYFLIKGVGLSNYSFEDVILIGVGYLGASLLGLIAIVSPGGIGVREGGFIFLLSSIYPESELLIIAFVLRFGLLFAELMLFLSSMLMQKLVKDIK